MSIALPGHYQCIYFAVLNQVQINLGASQNPIDCCLSHGIPPSPPKKNVTEMHPQLPRVVKIIFLPADRNYKIGVKQAQISEGLNILVILNSSLSALALDCLQGVWRFSTIARS